MHYKNHSNRETILSAVTTQNNNPEPADEWLWKCTGYLNACFCLTSIPDYTAASHFIVKQVKEGGYWQTCNGKWKISHLHTRNDKKQKQSFFLLKSLYVLKTRTDKVPSFLMHTHKDWW